MKKKPEFRVVATRSEVDLKSYSDGPWRPTRTVYNIDVYDTLKEAREAFRDRMSKIRYTSEEAEKCVRSGQRGKSLPRLRPRRISLEKVKVYEDTTFDWDEISSHNERMLSVAKIALEEKKAAKERAKREKLYEELKVEFGSEE